MRLIFILASFCHLSVLSARRKRVGSSEERDDEDWINLSCASYEDCLSAYDRMAMACGIVGKRAMDEDDSCYAPIAEQFEELVRLKGKRNELLRNCFRNGEVKGVEEKLRLKSDVGKKKRGSCKNKMASLDQMIAGSEDLKKILAHVQTKRSDPLQMSDSRCYSAAKRFKAKCHRIEACCIRVSECRRLVGRHPLVEKLRSIEGILKEGRRECKESHVGN